MCRENHKHETLEIRVERGGGVTFVGTSDNNVPLTFRSIVDNREDINKNGDAIKEGEGT